jgi:polar amino acid transport system permease protein
MRSDGPVGAGNGSRSPSAVDEHSYTSRTGTRIPFRYKVIAVWIGIFVVLALAFNLAGFDTAWMADNWQFIVKGIWVTIFITIVSIALAIVLALLGALGRLSKNAIAYGISGFYTSFFRGTPLIVQIYLIYFALPQIADNLGDRDLITTEIAGYLVISPVLGGILALGLNYGAYMTEIFRAGIQSVSHGQGEAAEALGMTYRQRMRRVVLPQAIRVIIPPTGNEFIAMIKDTALVSFTASTIFWYEIFKRAQVVGTADFRPMEAFLLVAGMYWLLTIVFTFFQSRLERRMSKGYIREEIKKVKAAGHGVQSVMPPTDEDEPR